VDDRARLAELLEKLRTREGVDADLFRRVTRELDRASGEPGREALEVAVETGTVLVDRELAAEFLCQLLLFDPLPHDDDAIDGWGPHQRAEHVPRHRAREHLAALAGQYVR